MRSSLSQVVDALKSVLLGKEHQVQLALATLLAQGHLLIEDLPGVGKTTLAYSLARSLDTTFSRIQFTSDLLLCNARGFDLGFIGGFSDLVNVHSVCRSALSQIIQFIINNGTFRILTSSALLQVNFDANLHAKFRAKIMRIRWIPKMAAIRTHKRPNETRLPCIFFSDNQD